MKRNVKEWLLRIVILLLGLTVAHLGVTLFLLSDLGSDPFNVFVQGLFRTLERLLHWPFLTHGRTHIAVSLLIVLVLLIVDRSYLKIGTALCMLFGGPIIDFFSALLSPALAGAALPLRVLMLVALIAGTAGFWIYVICWIAIPKAVTPAQKCEMNGLPVTAENLAKFATTQKK